MIPEAAENVVQEHKRADFGASIKDQGAAAFSGLAETLGWEVVQEALYDQGTTDELMKIWMEREEKMFMPLHTSIAQEECLSEDVRSVVLWFMAHLLRVVAVPEKSWFDVVALFDAYCLHAPSPVQVEGLPSLCGALARLVRKVDKVGFLPNESDLWACTMQLAQCLRQAGHTIDHPATTKEKLSYQEEQVLQVLEWRILLPSVDAWMSAFCSRMNTLSRQVLQSALAWIWQRGLGLARTMLLQRAHSHSFSPRHLVQGLLAMGFVAARMLSPDTLGLEGNDEWESLFLHQQPEVKPPAQTLHLAQQQLLLEVLQVATGSSLETLQEDCKMVETEMRNNSICQNARLHHTSI